MPDPHSLQLSKRKRLAQKAAGYLVGTEYEAKVDSMLHCTPYRQCRQSSCPFCWGGRIGRREITLEWISEMYLDPNSCVLVATLTVPNCHVGKLGQSLIGLRKALDILSSRKPFKAALGLIASREITVKADRPKDALLYHPHTHCLWLFRSREEAEAASAALPALFKEALGVDYQPFVWCSEPLPARENLASLIQLPKYIMKLPEIEQLALVVNHREYPQFYAQLNPIRANGKSRCLSLISLRGVFRRSSAPRPHGRYVSTVHYDKNGRASGLTAAAILKSLPEYDPAATLLGSRREPEPDVAVFKDKSPSGSPADEHMEPDTSGVFSDAGLSPGEYPGDRDADHTDSFSPDADLTIAPTQISAVQGSTSIRTGSKPT